MDESEKAAVTKAADAISSLEDTPMQEIPFELLDKQTRTTRLLSTSGDVQQIEGRNRWYEFKFKEPVLITTMTIETHGYLPTSEFEIDWLDDREKPRSATAKPQGDGLVQIEINRLCYGVAFKPPSMMFVPTKIGVVRVEGLLRGSIDSALETLTHLDEAKAAALAVIQKATARAEQRIENARQADLERGNAQRDVTNLKQQASRLKKSVDDLSLKRNELITANAEAERTLIDSNERRGRIEAEILQASSKLTGLKSDIQNSETQLASLKNNINLFPTEIVEFANQGSRNVKLYFWLALAPLMILVLMFVLLVRGAADLTTVITTDTDVNLQALFLSRLPYVVIATAIITACYKFSKAFFDEMVRINKQRLNLTKVSIIAKDISSAAETGLSLTDEATYRLRAELKMAILRDHLKEYLSGETVFKLPERVLGPSHKEDEQTIGSDDAQDR